MAKLANLSPFDQIARPLEGARTQKCNRSISYGRLFGAIYQDHFFKFKYFYFSLHPTDQQLPGDVDSKQLAWKRAPIGSCFGSSSKAAPCLQIDDKVFWNSIDNHNRSCERYIGLMSRCMSEGRVKDFREAEEKRQVDIGIYLSRKQRLKWMSG